VPQSPQAQVTVPFMAAQTVGNLNVVVIGWNDATSHVVSVSDTRGNAYSAALSPTVQPGIHTQVDLLRGGHRRLGCGRQHRHGEFRRGGELCGRRLRSTRHQRDDPVDAAAGASGTGTTTA